MAQAPRATAAERLDEPLDRNRNNEGELVDVGDEGELDEEDLAALRASIAKSEAQLARGEYVTSEQALAELDAILFGP